jgi:hypothetical protein
MAEAYLKRFKEACDNVKKVIQNKLLSICSHFWVIKKATFFCMWLRLSSGATAYRLETPDMWKGL